ncbi:protein of unknown function DUF820 [Halothece sp. PCC 7418]|uniref:Uma2 family endonuclease n=1 Tax=Halothece sp. (strain PCC 7418) TaxID=65093 RepID=UPI0002A08403|nr:Uma2 family endonuclease [Halothece sp. PCC 7418]AFZ44523.1 protein of unknown function DUF820 [Halothece sp. PCC 7418]
MITQLEGKIYSPEAYLELEIQSEQRHEYLDGEIIPMTGGTPNHNEIASILNALLRVNLRGQPYSIFVADQRLWIPNFNIYTYPDVMVVSHPVKLQEGRNDTVTNPLMIAEVLSKSTKSYDKDEKFEAYRSLSTFQEYLLIDQYKQHLEYYSKVDIQRWLFCEYTNPEDKITLSSVPVEFQLFDLYEGLELNQ